MNQTDIRLEHFSTADVERLISWIGNEKEMVKFAGPSFTFPLTKDQLLRHLDDTKRHAFNIIHNDTVTTIGHGEVYHTNEHTGRICLIIIGDKQFRGEGYGTMATRLLTDWSFKNLHTKMVDLNVYDFNTAAIKAYERVGFRIITNNNTPTIIDGESWTSCRMQITREQFYSNETG